MVSIGLYLKKVQRRLLRSSRRVEGSVDSPFFNFSSFEGEAKELNRTTRTIIVRSRGRAAKAHFALFKNLMKAKQRMRPGHAAARANALLWR